MTKIKIILAAILTLIIVGGAEAKTSDGMTLAQTVPSSHLDPHRETGGPSSRSVLYMFFDTLVELDPSGEYIPGLAKSWVLDEQGTQLTFELRSDVTFHDGTPFNAEAVKYN